MQGVPREDGFDITVASEVMAVLCLASSITDLKERLSRMVVAYTYDDKPVTAGDLKAAGAMTALLKDALKPNLVQTLEGTPAFIHGGPFANIAHGCNSIMATRIALKLGDYVVTEAGFGADLGAEKFLDIKCRMAGLKPSAVVVVATVRALKHHGGVAKADLGTENLEALERGLPNLLRHVENITTVFGLPCVVAINRFPLDTEAELALIEEKCKALGVNVALSEVWGKGGEGGKALAEEVVRLCEQPNDFHQAYELDTSIEDKLRAIVTKVYRGKDVAVLGSGAYALHEVQALLPVVKSVSLLTNGMPLTAEFPPEVTVCPQKVEAVLGEQVVTGVQLSDGQEVALSGVFVALGVAGSTALARKIGAAVEGSRIVVDEKMQTTVPGLYAAGDCTGGLLQVAKAVYEGAQAGTEAAKALRKG